MRGYENAKKCLLIDPHYVKKTPYFQYKTERNRPLNGFFIGISY